MAKKAVKKKTRKLAPLPLLEGTTTTGYKLLRHIRKLILDEPLRVDMRTYVAKYKKESAAPACGTVACVAGWGAISLNPVLDKKSEKRRGRVLNRVAEEIMFGAFDGVVPRDRLWEVFTSHEEYILKTDGYEDLGDPGSPQQAKTVAKRIDRLIAEYPALKKHKIKLGMPIGHYVDPGAYIELSAEDGTV